MASAQNPSTKPRVHLPLSLGRFWLFASIAGYWLLAVIVVGVAPNVFQLLVLGLPLVGLCVYARAGASTEPRLRPTGVATGIPSWGLFGPGATLERFRVMVKVVVAGPLVATGVSSAALGCSSPSVTVLPPEPLRACEIPAGAVTVTTVAQLKSELAKRTPQDIAIAPGDYTPSRVLTPAAPHRIWGTHANAVTIRAGFSFVGRGAPGFEVHCLTLDVADTRKADRRGGTAIIHSARNWTGITIADSRFLGNMAIGRALLVDVPDGLTVERVEIDGFTWDGMRIKSGSGQVVLRDLDIRNIEKPGKGHRNGTAEAGIHINASATIERVRIRNAYWMGIGTYDHDITIRDLDVDGSRSAVYLEHYTHRLLLERFHFGPANPRGLTFEWDDPDRYSRRPTTVDAVIQDGVVEAYRIGAAVMDGQVNPTIRRVTFRGQCGAAIVGNRPRSTGEVYVDNDYSGIRAGAKEVTTKHPNTMKCT